MKKTVFKDGPQYSVAMSIDTGCIVMTRSNGQKVTVMGSLTREDSLKFSQDILDWVPQAAQPERPKLALVN